MRSEHSRIPKNLNFCFSAERGDLTIKRLYPESESEEVSAQVFLYSFVVVAGVVLLARSNLLSLILCGC